MRNAVTLVWGSLRLAPITYYAFIALDVTFLLYCTEFTVEIEPPINLTVPEGPNTTVERCVVISGSDPIERSDFNVCVSTMDGTAVGKNKNCSTPSPHVFYLHHEVNGNIFMLCTLNFAIHV